MRIGSSVVTLALVAIANSGSGNESQSPRAEQVLDRSIAYHDPNGVWQSGTIRLEVQSAVSEPFATKLGFKDSTEKMVLTPQNDAFVLNRKMGDDVLLVDIQRGAKKLTLNGQGDIPEAERKRVRLVDDIGFYRNYYEYVYGVPMKLKDPGTQLDPDVTESRFDDRDVWEVKVAYAAPVGKDSWRFYFDRTTYALIGCRFYFDVARNDGEYIVYQGEMAAPTEGLRLAKRRTWYFNQNDQKLATEEIVALEATPGPQ